MRVTATSGGGAVLHRPTAPAVSGQGSIRWLRAVMVLALLLPALAFVAIAAYMYRQEFASARWRLDQAAHIAQEHTLKLFDTNEMLLQRMLDLLGNASDARLLARDAELHEQLKRMSAGLPQVQGLFVNGADGRAIANSRAYPASREIDYSDREWFTAHRSGVSDVFFTGQLVSRTTGEPFFDMSRRRSRPDGSFGGVVNVSLRPEYLTRFYEELGSSDADLRFTVLRADGSLITLSPGTVPPAAKLSRDSPVMRAVASGAAQGQADGLSTFDGADRLRAWRKLGDYPVYVVTAIDRDDVVGAWQGRIGLLALLAFPTALGFAWMAWFALRRTELALATAEALREEAERRARVEQTLVQSQKLEALGRLTGGVAHDFNNLLMIMLSNLHLLKHPGRADAGESLAAIGRSVDSGIKLTRQLLAFSSRQAAHPEVMRLQDELPPLADLIRPVLGSSVKLELQADAATSPVMLDPAQLELALLNLAVNARDAMPEGGTLKMELRNASRHEAGTLEGDLVLLGIIDTGVGIPAHIKSRVFEPFFTTKVAGQGTGLGLSQVYGFCTQAGGTATIESREGAGTSVKLFFPAVRERVERRTSAAAAALPSLRSRVLLVEDNPDVAGSCAGLLQKLGCPMRHCVSAEAALRELAQDDGYDVMLSDIVMPGGRSGLELAEIVRARYPDLAVILMTGFSSELDRARPEGPILQKPFTIDELAATLAAVNGPASPPAAG